MTVIIWKKLHRNPERKLSERKKRRRSARPLSVRETEQKEKFETAYKESPKLPRKERKEYVKKAIDVEYIRCLSPLCITRKG